MSNHPRRLPLGNPYLSALGANAPHYSTTRYPLLNQHMPKILSARTFAHEAVVGASGVTQSGMCPFRANKKGLTDGFAANGKPVKNSILEAEPAACD
jgi:hypothetical protein